MLQRNYCRRTFLLVAILAAYVGFQPSNASKLGTKNTHSDADKDAAIEEARRLVNAMNDAATGTITSYEPGHEPKKAGATCDEIMAKSLVVANEEKAAITAEKAAVVKAASLLTERIDELNIKLKEANDRVADLEQTIQSKVDAAAKEADERISKANDESLEELERMKLSMNALKNATAAKIEAKDAEMNNLREESSNEIKKMQAETESEKVRFLKLQQEDMEDLRKETAEKVSIYESQMAEVKATAESDIAKIKAEAKQQIENAHVEIAKIKAETERQIKAAIASTEAKVASEIEKRSETEKKLEMTIHEAKEKENEMSSNIAELTTSSTILQNEVSFWKETHHSQGYCNTTLIREDSRKLVLNALESTKNGFANTQQLLSSGLQEKLVPQVEKMLGEACEKALEAYNMVSSKAIVLYKDHVATVVDKTIVPALDQHVYPILDQHVYPVLDQHVYPVWKKQVVPLIDQGSERVSPIVKTIEKETKKNVKMAREGIAPRLESWSSSVIKFAQKNNFFNKLPAWVSTPLTRAAEDGQWALDTLSRAYLLLLVVLFRSLIFRIIWFFCPLRLFFRKRKPENDNNNGGKKKVVKSEPKSNGSMKNGRKNAKVF